MPEGRAAAAGDRSNTAGEGYFHGSSALASHAMLFAGAFPSRPRCASAHASSAIPGALRARYHFQDAHT